MTESRVVYLVQAESGKAIEARLVTPLTEKHVKDWRDLWQPFQIEQLKKLREGGMPLPEHKGWTWDQKYERIQKYLAYHGYAVECEGVTQGLGWHKLAPRTCKLADQKGKPLVYVAFVETAPWNRPFIGGSQRFRGVGSILVRSAVDLSIDSGFHGRVGLHSLPQSESFYRKTIGMTEVGIDVEYERLMYFEMTPAEAEAFVNKGKQ